MEERILDGHLQDDELTEEMSLRPTTLRQYIGQHKVKENLQIFIKAAKMRNEPLDHVLLYGPPGLGKQLWRPSSPMKWESSSGPPPVRR